MTVLTEDMKRMVAALRLAYVATVSPDGWPYISPRGSVRVRSRNQLMWVDNDTARTIQNIDENPKTVLAVVDPFSRRGYRFSGRSSVLRDGPDHAGAIEMYRTEGADLRGNHPVVILDLESATPCISPTYALGFDEEEIRRLWVEYYSEDSRKTVKDLIPPQEF